MKKLFWCFCLMCLTCSSFFFVMQPSCAEARNGREHEPLLIASFDIPPVSDGAPVYNELGGQYGIWDRFPEDESQSIILKHILREDSKDNHCVRLHYDVDSENPAYNGFWLKLNRTDLTVYNRLNLSVRGDAAEGFTTRFKLELKDFETSASFMLTGVTAEWKRFSIPFSKYWKIKDWSEMNELVIVFDDIFSRPRSGVIYIDDITVTRE